MKKNISGPSELQIFNLPNYTVKKTSVCLNTGLLEMSLGKFRNVLLNETNPVEAVIRNIASNVTLIIFQAHAQQKDVTVSFDKVGLKCSVLCAC